jgi:hypothetical protein
MTEIQEKGQVSVHYKQICQTVSTLLCTKKARFNTAGTCQFCIESQNLWYIKCATVLHSEIR